MSRTTDVPRISSATAAPSAQPIGRAARRGFSLIEIVVVVAIVAIGTGIAVYSSSRNKEILSADRATAAVRVRVERAQALAAVAGSRLGTPRVILAGACVPGPTPDPYLWVQVNTDGTIVLPAEVIQNGDGTVTLQCEVFDINAETRGDASLEYPAATTVFGFTADGRLFMPTAAPGNRSFYFGVRSTNGGRRFAFRVLPSGVICTAGEPDTVRCAEET